jgi:hypothetical protein
VKPATNIRRNGPASGPLSRQHGQALVYGIFVLFAGLAALFFLFNSGQLVRDKTKLVNTADAVTYAASVMEARTLNYEAYANRAMMANTVAIAQLVSISSWVQYEINLGTIGTTSGNITKYPTFYASFLAAQTSQEVLQSTLIESGALERLATGSDTIIRRALMNAQQVAYIGLIAARQQVMEDVARANYLNDGSVSVEPLTPADFMGFIKLYQDSERTRFGDAARTAAFKDRFVRRRTWVLPGLYPDCTSAFPRRDWLDRRGGTEMVSLDQWQAVDTMSEKVWVPANKWDIFCRAITEIPQGYGMQMAADNATTDLDPLHYDYSMLVNPLAHGMAVGFSSDAWGYSGIPNFYDLSADALKQPDPRLKFAVRVRRAISETPTSEGRSAIATTARLNAYTAAPAGGNELVAVSASEVFFERPETYEHCADNSFARRDNCYGRSNGTPTELGSLFNPYWQVHLIRPEDYRATAAALQGGAILP